MIRSLRQRHRRIMTGLAVCLPVAFVVGIASRRAVPAMPSLPDGLGLGGAQLSESGAQWYDLFPKTHVQVRPSPAGRGGGRAGVELSAPEGFLKPDLLVYWAPGLAGATDGLPDQAVLLGPFQRSATLPLPSGRAGGLLVLYSLADQEIIDASQQLPF